MNQEIKLNMGLNRSIAGMDPQLAAEKAVSVIGQGYDLCSDIRFSACKSSTLIEIDHKHTRDMLFPVPGSILVHNVPSSIKCDKGERTRFHSDVLTFNQMSEHFNRQLSLSGKIPSGVFNAMFDMRRCWPKDAAATKSLAFDGCFISLYTVELDRTNLTLSDQVKKDVPSSWNPAALASFIDKYGTHVIVGVKMGGKDVVHIKQSKNSDLPPAELQKLLKQLADERQNHFPPAGRPVVKSHSKNDEIMSVSVRRGGIDIRQPYNQWLQTILQSPNVISMSFVPITSLLNSVPGNGFLSHAVNLYLRCEQTFLNYFWHKYRMNKPAIEDLHHFLEFQLPRQWAPMYGDLPLGYGHKHKKNMSPSLQFSLMGPKLYVNTVKVDSGNRPVTGIRLYLESKKNDHLAIHLQHLAEIPGFLEISEDNGYEPIDEPVERGYYEPVKWSMFSHVYTAPVQYNSSRIDESTAIVTKAWFEVKLVGMKKVLFLRLGFSTVASAKIRRSEWDGPSTMSRKSGFFSALMSTKLSKELKSSPEKANKVEINSAIYQGGPPVPTRAPRMLSFVDTKEMVRGPEDTPGYWVVTGAKLCVDNGRISIKAKYSLLTVIPEEAIE
ncbi:hypothetical protein Ahy_A03g011531 isoform B [Arachis hypogaea]|uniref:MACPF domain-containing protein n=2 Tax=Arachis hypogaea TaxID=3818 RepID=A0A445DR06_ARAHY|nr:hypothetical protein Ahy_A03g011531 isoform B [Arachis hypogaea]